MAARFIALRNNRIAAVFFQPARLPHRCRAGNNAYACGLDPRKQGGVGQAEMKADHIRLDFLNQCAHALIKGAAGRRRSDIGRVKSELFIEWRETGGPGRLLFRRRSYGGMAEKIHVERFCRLLPNNACFGAYLIFTQHGTGKGAEPARLAYRNCHGGTIGPRHGRLDDRQFDLKQI